jgi:hypothetical protein
MAMEVHILEGVASYAKIVGPARANNFGEIGWEFDLQIDSPSKKDLISKGVPREKIKNDKDRGDYVQFKRRAQHKDGTKANPIPLVDAYGDPWDQKKLIGNGSRLAVKYTLREGKKGLIPSALEVCVRELVPYKPKDAFGFKEKPKTHGEEDWTNTSQSASA